MICTYIEHTILGNMSTDNEKNNINNKKTSVYLFGSLLALIFRNSYFSRIIMS